jgi:glycosyltransferase involved in cell wall biosynthesis
VIAERLPRPDISSGSARFLSILTEAARFADIDLWVERDEAGGWTPLPAARVAADRERLADLGIRVHPSTWQALRRSLSLTDFDAVLLEFYDVAARYLPLVRDLQPCATIVVDTVDVHFARLAAGVPLGAVSPRMARRVRRAETAIYRAADALIAVSDADAAILAAEPGMPPIVCVPTLVTPRPRLPRPRQPEAIFVGHFQHAPNLDGLTWFVRDVWPSVRRRHPAACLTIVGSHASADVHALAATPGVSVLGYVPDLAPLMDRAMVALAPLRYGAGMKGKVTDALAAGVPVVTTTIGAQGLDLVHGRDALIADAPDAFAEAVSALFDDPARAAAIGLAGQAVVARRCSPDTVAGVLGPLLVPRAANAPARNAGTRQRTGHDGRVAQQVRRLRLSCRHWIWTQARRHIARLRGNRGRLESRAPRIEEA